MLERTYRIIADIFQLTPEQVHPGASPDTIANWDSLRHLNLVLALEQEFGVEFTPEEIEQMLSVELITDLLTEKATTVARHAR